MRTICSVTLLLLISTLLPASSFASLEETERELSDRYGSVIKEGTNDFGLRTLRYKWRNIVVKVHLDDGVSHFEQFITLDDDASLSEDEIQLILQINAASVGWSKSSAKKGGGKIWERLDKKATATLDKDSQSMGILSKTYIDKYVRNN